MEQVLGHLLTGIDGRLSFIIGYDAGNSLATAKSSQIRATFV